jgi:hypothetical protein
MLERELESATGSRTRATAPVARAPGGRSAPADDANLRIRLGERRAGERRRGPATRGAISERELVRVLLHRPSHFDRVIESKGPENFRDPELGAIFLAMARHGPDAGADAFAPELSPDAIELLQSLLEEDGGLEHADAEVAGALARMRARDLRQQLHDLQRLLEIATPEEQDRLLREKEALARELRSLGGGQQWAAVRAREDDAG